MNGNNLTSNNGDWVRLNVGGKVFQTSKDTLSRFPESFLACLVNAVIPSDKDETVAFLIDRDAKHFHVILNYLRNGELIMDRNEIAAKELLREAEFYCLHALIEEIKKPIRSDAQTIVGLREQNQHLQQEATCIICLDNKREVLFLPCMHFNHCNACAKKNDQCGTCRTNIRAKIVPLQ